jgi:hypothetical protein
MQGKGRLLRLAMATLIVPVILFSPLYVLAGGVNHQPLGAETFLAGVFPPAGFYFKEYLSFYTADTLKDNHGRTLSLARSGAKLDKLDVFAAVQRPIYISPVKILGGDLGVNMIIPWVRPSIKLDALTPAGGSEMRDHHNGVGDIAIGPHLSWHTKDGLLHYVLCLMIDAPTGKYNPRNLVNVGSNVWGIDLVGAATLFLPWHPNLEFSIKMDYGFNTKNDNFIISPSVASKIGNMGLIGLKTNLTPGQDFHFDYCIGYALSKEGAPHQFKVGATGYFYQQATDDDTGSGKVKNDKGRVFAIGPGVWWTYKKWIVEAHVDYEIEAKNRPQGINSWLTIIYKF